MIRAGDLVALMTHGLFTTAEYEPIPLESDLISDSPASIIRAYIIEVLKTMSDPEGSSQDWPLFLQFMPDEVSNCGAIYDTTPVLDGRLMSGVIIQHYGLQLKLRAVNSAAGFEKLEEVAAGLDSIHNVQIEFDDTIYEIQGMQRTTGLVPVGLERGTKRRYLFTINYLMTIRKIEA